MQINSTVCFASNRTADHIADSHGWMAFALNFAQRSQRIDRFAALGKCKQQGFP